MPTLRADLHVHSCFSVNNRELPFLKSRDCYSRPEDVYRVAKAAVVQFSKSAAIDLAPHGIRVNCIAPGHIPTGITNYDLGSVIRTMQPLQREGRPADVADAVLYLASDRSAQITGIVLPIDGGTSAGPPVTQLRDLMRGVKAAKEKEQAAEGGER